MSLFTHTRRALLAALLASAAFPASAALRLHVAAVTTNTVNPDGKAPPGGTTQSDVVLADGYISSRSGDTTTVYDFVRRRRYVLDDKAKTYDEYSLFDVVGFRELELRNRQGLRQALAAAHLEGQMPGQLEAEHELSVPGGQPVTVETRADGKDEVFASGDVALLRRGADTTAVSAADAQRFASYLRYTFTGHPAALAALQKEQRIPSRLVYSFHPAWGTSTIELTITALRQDEAPGSFKLDGYAPRPAPDLAGPTLDAILDRAWTSRMTLGAARPQAAAIEAEMRNAPPLQGFLALTEVTLMGERPPMPAPEVRLAWQADPAIRTLSQALAAKDQNALRQAAGTLELLRPQAGTRVHVLRLYEANDRAQLGDAKAAQALYADVLRANPALAGAYKDVGDFYYRHFDTPRAWRSWEVARTLAPLFVNLGAITQFERALAERYPEYF